MRTHAVFVDVEALWSKVEFGDAARGLRSEKERSYLAAYDAPFHGVPGHTPYAHGRYSDMNDHIAKVHSRFLESPASSASTSWRRRSSRRRWPG